MTTTELHVRVGCSCVHVRFAVLLCKRFGDFGKKERESLESH